MEEVYARQADKSSPIHTMHVARAAAEHLGITEGEVYVRYLGRGKAAESIIGRPTPFEAIDCIHACGGLAFLAHPGRIEIAEEAKPALVAALAALSSLVLGLIGKSNTPNLGDSLAVALLVHALLPAILEELVFRYIPLRICERGHNGTLVLISALFFALSHHSFFSFGYAFLAGCIFMAIDLVCESVIPSMVIHLFNNALSVLLMFYSQNTTLTLVLWLAVGASSLASLVYLFIKRRELSALVRERVISGEKYRPSYEILFLLIPSLVIAILEIAG
jgi:hypothetical protein